MFESDLVRQIEVRRKPQRQAMQRLQHQVLVEAIPKAGRLIVSLNFEKFEELYEFRILIECCAARKLCTTTKNPPELQPLARNSRVPAAERLQER